MAIMLGKLYEALLHRDDAQLAREAAEEVAGYESRLASIEGRLLLVQWMIGTNVVLTIGVLWMVFTIMGRLP